MTTTQRKAISSPPEGLEVYDTTAHVKVVYNGTRWLEIRSDPIGTIKAWHKSFTNTPALPYGWVECSGQTLSDADSVYNGQVIPNLNSATQDGSTSSGMFLRGGVTSGTMQADATAVNGLSATTNGSRVTASTDGATSCCGWYVIQAASASVTMSSTDTETHPPNMTVIWIMRVK